MIFLRVVFAGQYAGRMVRRTVVGASNWAEALQKRALLFPFGLAIAVQTLVRIIAGTAMGLHIRRCIVLLAIGLSSACARSIHSGKSTPDKNHSLITRTELVANRFNNAYDAVSSLRSNWLQPRGTDSFNTPSKVWVYFDSIRLGGVETLTSISVTPVSYIEHFDGVTATARWGVGHSAGVIYVSTHPIVTSSTQ